MPSLTVCRVWSTQTRSPLTPHERHSGVPALEWWDANWDGVFAISDLKGLLLPGDYLISAVYFEQPALAAFFEVKCSASLGGMHSSVLSVACSALLFYSLVGIRQVLFAASVAI